MKNRDIGTIIKAPDNSSNPYATVINGNTYSIYDAGLTLRDDDLGREVLVEITQGTPVCKYIAYVSRGGSIMKKKLYTVVQEGGTSSELYVNGYDTKRDADAFIKSASESSYNTIGPIEVPQPLADLLRANKEAEEAFYEYLQTLVRAVATEL